MKLNQQVKKQRMLLNLSQEALAEKIYVSRQSVSNWETSKSYPDIHSLLLMSSLFNVSLDELIKGDIEQMKEEISNKDRTQFNAYGKFFSILFIILVISIAPLWYYFEIYGALIAFILFIGTMLFSLKLERQKKEYDIQTYKEIISFLNGTSLDEISKHQEFGKRPYQKILLVFVLAVVGFFTSYLLMMLLSSFH